MRHALVLTAATLALAVTSQASAHARLILGAPKAGATVAAPKTRNLNSEKPLMNVPYRKAIC